MDISKVSISKKAIKKSSRKINSNEAIADYYLQKYDEDGFDTFKNARNL